jgi:uncharacterized protein (DUF1015 family)
MRMAEITPFRALRYNPQFVPDLKLVVAPPYDVISPEAQERYHARHPHNVVRLILARQSQAGTPGQDRYARSARTFAEWKVGGILRRDPRLAIYLYEQEFSVGEGHRVRRRGFMAMVRLHDYDDKVIFPHERTFSEHKEDRLQLMRACPANLEAILGFYAGPVMAISAVLTRHMEGEPAVQLADEDGICHRLWILREPTEMATLTQALQDRAIIIADGHHRYETALTFRDERRAADTGPPEGQGRRLHDWVLMNLVHAEDPGLLILPTHRLIRQRPVVAGAALREALGRHFRIDELPLDRGNPLMSLRIALADLHRRRRAAAFAVYAGGGEVLVLELAEETVVEELTAAGRSREYARLDVAILHRLVIEQILGIRPTGLTDDSIQYTRDEGMALAAVASGDAHLALFLNPPRVEQVQAIAMAGDRMPQKSTFFFPKVLSGLVISPLDAIDLAAT